jgi:oxygen-independent coproporphyrinogen-3 oxidase
MSVSAEQAFEETFFLGLRLNRGVDLGAISRSYGPEMLNSVADTIEELVRERLLQKAGEMVYLTPRGRVLSNEVFQNFLMADSDSLVS